MSDTPIYDYIHKVLRCNCYLADLGGIECNNCKAKRDLFDLERRNAELTARIAELEATCETWKETAEAAEESARNLATFANDDNCFNLPMGGASITARDAIRRLRNDLCDAAEHLNAVYKQRDEAEKKAKERFDQIDALTSALTEARKDGQWRDISTAPKDGTVVDLIVNGHRIADCAWGKPTHECGEAGPYCDSDWHGAKKSWFDTTFNWFIDTKPTHWRAITLPSPKETL